MGCYASWLLDDGGAFIVDKYARRQITPSQLSTLVWSRGDTLNSQIMTPKGENGKTRVGWYGTTAVIFFNLCD